MLPKPKLFPRRCRAIYLPKMLPSYYCGLEGQAKLHMMLIIVLAAMPLWGAAHSQGPRAIPPPDKDPFVGTWKANQDKSQPRLSNKEASYTRTISRDGADLVFSSRMGSSKRSQNNYKIRCDGQLHRVPFGHLSCSYRASNIVEGETRSDDQEIHYWTREVSTDGKEMRILSYQDSGHLVLISVEILDRVK